MMPILYIFFGDNNGYMYGIDTDGNIEGAGGIGMATTGKAIAMAVVFGG